jgi:hypothetical protein
MATWIGIDYEDTLAARLEDSYIETVTLCDNTKIQHLCGTTACLAGWTVLVAESLEQNGLEGFLERTESSLVGEDCSLASRIYYELSGVNMAEEALRLLLPNREHYPALEAALMGLFQDPVDFTNNDSSDLEMADVTPEELGKEAFKMLVEGCKSIDLQAASINLVSYTNRRVRELLLDINHRLNYSDDYDDDDDDDYEEDED